MKIVEMYDDEAIENVAASLKYHNDELILIGYNLRKMEKGVTNIRNMFAAMGREIKITCIEVIKNNLELMLETIEQMITDESFDIENTLFNVNGGDDLVLVAMGIMAHKYNINIISFDVAKSKVLWQLNTDNRGTFVENQEKNSMTVRENILLHGGEVVGPENTPGCFYPWSFDEEFCSDVNEMWDICREDCLKWNREISDMQNLVDKGTGLIFGKPNDTMNKLVEAGFIEYLGNGVRETFVFKNETVKDILMKVGDILELYVTITAMGVNREDDRLFADVKTGVVIDWDGVIHDIHDRDKDTRNEIDVILMKGVCPIFISCKNGDVSIDELYKLNTVAEKFGGKYAKKMLIATYFGKKGTAKDYFVQRAQDMKIQLITDAQNLSREELEKRLKNI